MKCVCSVCALVFVCVRVCVCDREKERRGGRERVCVQVTSPVIKIEQELCERGREGGGDSKREKVCEYVYMCM